MSDRSIAAGWGWSWLSSEEGAGGRATELIIGWDWKKSAKLGSRVEKGDPLVWIHAKTRDDIDRLLSDVDGRLCNTNRIVRATDQVDPWQGRGIAIRARDLHDPNDPCACRFEAGLGALGRDFVIVETLKTRDLRPSPVVLRKGFRGNVRYAGASRKSTGEQDESIRASSFRLDPNG